MVVKNEKFTSFIDEFTSSTYIMVICSDPDIEQEAIAMNIKASRDYFESIMQSFEKWGQRNKRQNFLDLIKLKMTPILNKFTY